MPMIQSDNARRLVNITLPPMWKHAASCGMCMARFTLLKKRHHCRNCGMSVCGEHSNKQAPLPEYGVHDCQRVCWICYENLKNSGFSKESHGVSVKGKAKDAKKHHDLMYAMNQTAILNNKRVESDLRYAMNQTVILNNKRVESDKYIGNNMNHTFIVDQSTHSVVNVNNTRNPEISKKTSITNTTDCFIYGSETKMNQDHDVNTWQENINKEIMITEDSSAPNHLFEVDKKPKTDNLFNMKDTVEKSNNDPSEIFHFKKETNYTEKQNPFDSLKLIDDGNIDYTANVAEQQHALRSFTNAGLVLYSEKKYYRALVYFRRATRICPIHADSWINVAQCMYVVRDYQDAAIACRRAIELNPGDPTYFHLLVKILGAIGEDTSEAMKSYHSNMALVDEPILQNRMELPQSMNAWL